MSCRRSKSQEVRPATWNVSRMVCQFGEVMDALHRRKIDFCYAQETRWKDGSARMPGAIGRAVIRGLLVLVCLLLRMWIDSVVDVVRVHQTDTAWESQSCDPAA